MMTHCRKIKNSLTFLLISLATFSHAAKGRQPNVVFILADDLAWTDPGCYGNPYHETPAIDQLAKEGIRFTDAYASAPLCSATRAAALTGWAPARQHLHGTAPHVKNNRFHAYESWADAPQYSKNNRKPPFFLPKQIPQLPLSSLTMGEAFLEAGFRTAFIGKWHLSYDKALEPHAQGFEEVLAVNGLGWPRSYYPPFQNAGLKDLETDVYLTDRLTDEALQVIERHKSEPFFLYLSHYAVHGPWQGAKAYLPYFEEKLKKVEFNGNAHYAAMLRSLDDSVRRIVEGLERLGLRDDTIIVFTSDNGGKLFDKEKNVLTDMAPLRGEKALIYEGGVRVPTIISWPGKIPKGKVSDALFVTHDFFPTLISSAGLEKKSSDLLFDGVDQTPVLKGNAPSIREQITFHMPHNIMKDNGDGLPPTSAIRKGKYKYYYSHISGKKQLFDLHQDLSEADDLSTTKPELAQKLHQDLMKDLKEKNAFFAIPNPDYQGGE